MSNHPMNYVPFDVNTYTHVVLPALIQATEGETEPLLNLIRSARHFSCWELMNQPVPFSLEELWRLSVADIWDFVFNHNNDFGTQIKKEDVFNPWSLLQELVPELVGKKLVENDEGYGGFLHLSLLFTFCCDLPLSSVAREDHVIFDYEGTSYEWQDYISNGPSSTIWSTFHQPAPQEIAALYTSPDNEVLYSSDPCPRELGIFGGGRLQPSGFMTPEETRYLLTHVQVHSEPITPSIISRCISNAHYHRYNWETGGSQPRRDDFADWKQYAEADECYVRAVFEKWMREHPAHMVDLLQHQYRNLWLIEDRVMAYVRYAVSRGWGMLEFYD